jgi:hypothetical protein
VLFAGPLPTVKSFTLRSELNVLDPSKVCVPVVTTPPKKALAGCKLSVEPEILAPFAFGIPPIAANAVIPAGDAHAGLPLTLTVST